MEIVMNSYKYKLDENGNTVGVLVGYQQKGFSGENTFMASVEISKEDLQTGEELDDLRKSDFDTLARTKISSWI